MDTTQSQRTEPPRRLPKDLRREIRLKAKEEIAYLDRLAEGQDPPDQHDQED